MTSHGVRRHFVQWRLAGGTGRVVACQRHAQPVLDDDAELDDDERVERGQDERRHEADARLGEPDVGRPQFVASDVAVLGELVRTGAVGGGRARRGRHQFHDAQRRADQQRHDERQHGRHPRPLRRVHRLAPTRPAHRRVPVACRPFMFQMMPP